MAQSAAYRTSRNAALSRGGSIAAVLAQTVLLFTLTTLPTPLYGDYARAFRFSNLILTLIYATYVAGTLSALFLLGRLSDQIGRKPVCFTAISGAAMAAVLFLLADGTAWLFAARLATGLAAGLSSGTAVAWLRELHGEKEQKQGSLKTVAANVLGLGVGPLLGGVLAQTTSPPLQIPYWVYLALLVPLAAVVARSQETVAQPKPVSRVKLGVRVGVPSDLRTAFLAPGITTFVIFSLVGFYSALAPSLMAKTLAIQNHAATGGLVCLLFMAGTVTVYATRRLGSRAAMLWGAGLMLPALALLVVAELAASLPAFVAGTVMGGLSLGAGYRGTLEVGNEIAPDDKRAELISMLFVCGNLGLAIPVIGIGVLAALTSPRLADLAFAGVIALLSVGGLAFGLKKSQQTQGRKL